MADIADVPINNELRKPSRSGWDLRNCIWISRTTLPLARSQPVVLTNGDGKRESELMRWGFKTPKELLFNARSEGITRANFWKESFDKRRCIVPADTFLEWENLKRNKAEI